MWETDKYRHTEKDRHLNTGNGLKGTMGSDLRATGDYVTSLGAWPLQAMVFQQELSSRGVKSRSLRGLVGSASLGTSVCAWEAFEVLSAAVTKRWRT